MTTPEPMGVDGPSLAGFGNELVASAAEIPLAPPPFVVGGADAISLKIASLLPSIEGPIQTGLPQLKTDAADTARKIVEAAAKYDQTDEQLARTIEALLADRDVGSGGAGAESSSASSGLGTGSASPGGAGAATGSMGSAGVAGAAPQSGGADQMGQMMGMAGQAAQLPMQAVGMAAAIPQAIMAGVAGAVQQISQLTGGLGGKDGSLGSSGERDEPDKVEEAEESTSSPRERDVAGREPSGAAPAAPHAERAPVEAPAVPGNSSAGPAQPEPKPPAQTRPAEVANRMRL